MRAIVLRKIINEQKFSKDEFEKRSTLWGVENDVPFGGCYHFYSAGREVKIHWFTRMVSFPSG